MPNDPFDDPPENEDFCGKELSSKPGKFCSNMATSADGRCGFHSDKGSGNIGHGAYAKRSNYYDSLPAEEKDWIKGLYKSFIDEAPFDGSSKGKCEMLWDVCIDIHKKRRINDYIEGRGMARDKVVGVSDSGPVYEEEENPLHLTYDRLSRSTIKTLKELGCLDDPQSKQANAQQSFVDLFRDLDE